MKVQATTWRAMKKLFLSLDLYVRNCSKSSFMDGNGRFSPRNWKFTDEQQSESMSEPAFDVSLLESNASGKQPGFLKVSAYPNQANIVGELNSEASSISCTWDSRRNFHHPTEYINHLQAIPFSSEMLNVQSMPAEEITLNPDGPIDAIPINARKQTSKANRVAVKVARTKEGKKQPSASINKKGYSSSTGKQEKNNHDISLNGIMMDLSGVPSPVCSCTGVPRQCYRWGHGGWQSSCCTTSLSEYPLPVSPRRPGARVAGRKMSIGAYIKLLHKLAAEGHNLSYAVDLKNHWARHGTNKFVTIR